MRLRLIQKSKESEAAYKRAVTVLEAAENKAAEAENASEKSGKKDETDTNQVLRRLAREDLANTLCHLADLYAIQERNQDAADCFRTSTEIYQSMLGGNQWSVDDSPMGQELVQSLTGLAQASIELKDYDSANHA